MAKHLKTMIESSLFYHSILGSILQSKQHQTLDSARWILFLFAFELSAKSNKYQKNKEKNTLVIETQCI